MKDIYIYKGNIHLKGCLPLSPRESMTKSQEKLTNGEGMDLSLHNNHTIVCCAFPESLP